MMKSISIDGRLIGRGYSPYIIAELSANHNGFLNRALQTIDAAFQAGASAIKLQTYTADTMTIDCDFEDFMIKGGLWDGYKLYDLYKWAETPFEWHQAIFDRARELGITVFSTPFDESAVELLEQLDAPAYKIASFENTDLPLIRFVAKTGKPMIMSTGMASEEEIFDVVSGLSDHTLGTAASVAAVALGACVIEKHFTLSRADKGPDSEFSIEPSELIQLCQDTHDAWQSLGKVGYDRQPAEKGSKIFRRSVYFVRDLPAGSVIQSEDIRRIRPGMGLAPKNYDQLLGKKLKFSVQSGTPTSWDLFDD